MDRAAEEWAMGTPCSSGTRYWMLGTRFSRRSTGPPAQDTVAYNHHETSNNTEVVMLLVLNDDISK